MQYIRILEGVWWAGSAARADHFIWAVQGEKAFYPWAVLLHLKPKHELVAIPQQRYLGVSWL